MFFLLISPQVWHFWFLVKYLSNFWMDFNEPWFRYFQYPEDESKLLCDFSAFYQASISFGPQLISQDWNMFSNFIWEELNKSTSNPFIKNMIRWYDVSHEVHKHRKNYYSSIIRIYPRSRVPVSSHLGFKLWADKDMRKTFDHQK